MTRLREAHPDKVVEAWSQDELRAGLKPIVRRVWSPRGERPKSCGRTKYEWMYAYGFVHPSSGRNLQALVPHVDAEAMSAVLDHFAKWADPDGRKILVVILDNAGWHVAKGLAVPANVRLHPLPPHTPELAPVESLWPLVREALANRTFDDMEALDAKLGERCAWLMDHPETVRGRCGHAWAAALG